MNFKPFFRLIESFNFALHFLIHHPSPPCATVTSTPSFITTSGRTLAAQEVNHLFKLNLHFYFLIWLLKGLIGIRDGQDGRRYWAQMRRCPRQSGFNAITSQIQPILLALVIVILASKDGPTCLPCLLVVGSRLL